MMTKRIIILSFYLLVIFTATFFRLAGQNKPVAGATTGIKEDTLRKEIVLFGSDDVLEVAIRFDLNAYLKKNLNGGSLNGVLTFNPGKNDSLSKNIVINTRGAFRLERCSFAPMEIKFKRPLNAYTDSGKIKKLKLVTHCQSGQKYDEYLLREFLVYKLYSVLTDTSFRVRLLKVNYIDTQKKKKPIIQFGFFIEPKAILATRTNSTVIEAMNLTQKNIKPKIMDRVAIFNYMVGNWDWAVQSLHNIEVIKPLVYDPTGSGIAVPFDFDLTGVVDPDYNMPPPESGLTSNRDRLYMGMCRDRATFQNGLTEYITKKDEFYKVINAFPYLNDRAKKDLIYYLDTFFDQLEKQRGIDNLVSSFLNSCKRI